MTLRGGSVVAMVVLKLSLVVVASILTWPLAASAQSASKVYRIGYLSYLPCPGRPEFMDPFHEGLRGLGYLEGQNMVMECRDPAGAAELARLRVDVLVAAGTVSALAAKKATSTIPIVMANVGDPVENGLVTSLARPGGNLTGFSVLTPEVASKALEILKEAVPALTRVAIWMDRTNPGQTVGDRQMDASAKILGVRLSRLDVRTAANLDAAFAAARSEREDAVLVFPLPLSSREVQRIAPFAIKNRFPTMAFFPEYVRGGMLMSSAPNQAEAARRVGVYVDKILKGAKPADLPVEQPTKFDLVINLRTARALGLTMPPSILLRADRVIE